MAVSFSRTTEGLIFRDQFNRANDPSVGNGWTEIGATSLLSLTDNQLKKASGAGAGVRQTSSLTPGNPLIIQANFRPGADIHGSFLVAEADAIQPITDGYVWRADDAGFSDPTVWTIRNVVGGSQTVLATSNGPNQGSGDIYGHRGVIDGTTIRQLRSIISSLGDIVTDFSLIQEVVDAAPPDVGDRGTVIGCSIASTIGEADEFICCGVYITVSGLPTGWKVQVDSRTAVVESGGSVSIDVHTWALPATTIRILDDGDVEQETLTPGTGIWGGDAYAYVANTQPDKPTISVDDVTDTTADLSSSAFSDPDVGDAHESSQWQVDLATGDFSSPVADSGEDMVNLLSITSTGLTPATQYQTRVRHKDDSGNPASEWSEWSDPASFTTNTFSEPEEPTSTSYTTVTPPATSYSSCAEPTSASWSSCIEADATSWSSCPTPTTTSWSSC